jgi:hypothetical protein
MTKKVRALAAFAVALASAWLVAGCSAPVRAPATPSYGLPSLPPRPDFEPTQPEAQKRTSVDFNDALVSGSLAHAEVYSVQQSGSRGGGAMGTVLGKLTPGRASSSTGAASARAVALPGTDAAKEEEKIEREAQLAIQVKDVNEGAARVLALVRAHEGTVTKDQRSSGTQSTAEIIVRVPSSHFDAFTSELASVGEINPYLGARVGFAQTQDRGDFAAAGVFGLELFKTSALMIDLQARAMAMVGNPDGPHAAIQPSVGFDLGF